MTGMTEAQAANIAKKHFGIDGTAQTLAGEYDLNFRIDAANQSYLLKVASVGTELASITLLSNRYPASLGKLCCRQTICTLPMPWCALRVACVLPTKYKPDLADWARISGAFKRKA